MWLWSFGLLWNIWSAFGTSASLLWISGNLSLALFSLKGSPELVFNSPFLQQSCGSGVLADGRLADLIRRVTTFGMVLMKLDLRQVCFRLYVYFCLSNRLWPEQAVWQESGRHAETLDAITGYLDMGTYSEWDEEKKLDFLTRELKGKRPLVPLSIEVRWLAFLTGRISYRIEKLLFLF